jgi:hypothetical protein
MAQSRAGQAQKPSEQQRRGRARLGEDFAIGSRVTGAVTCRMYERKADDPVFRPLRIYALDPTASVEEGALAVVNVPYEPIECGPRGPRGAILEIVDDGHPGVAAPGPLNLDEAFVLMQQGRLPSPEDAYFRQQMAYAVCTTTYAAFRQALGRDVAWGFHRSGSEADTQRLRIRPSVADLQNAFYDRIRGELQFGVFNASNSVAGRNVPGGRISLCLSHDVVVHEMSHALLDGMRSHFLLPSNLDVLAFHEAFADLIAIFQRFTYRDVVLTAIRASRGNVSSATLLTSIGVQFAQAMDATGALRTAVAGTDHRYEDAVEPHHRGEVLVAAVFEAFASVYHRKTTPLVRLATRGSGVLAPGDIPEGLAALLTDHACKLASHFLAICIRAIDYCPPVDITFGEYLRAVITADTDLIPYDEWGYREAWTDAFAVRRIYPADVPSLSQDALRWRSTEQSVPPEPELSFARLQFDGDPGRAASREELLRQATAFGQLVADPAYRAEFGLAAAGDPRLDGDDISLPVIESIRSTRRIGPSGQIVMDLVAEVTQRRSVRANGSGPGFDFYGGATVILNPQGAVRYVVRKSVLDGERLRRQREFIISDGARFFGRAPGDTRIPESKLLLQLHDVTRPQFRAGSAARIVARDLSSLGAAEAARTYVLRQGDSSPAVALLKACLNKCLSPSPALDDLDAFDPATERAVIRLQSDASAAVDGIVGPATWSIIGKTLGYVTDGLPMTDAVPMWIKRLLSNDAAKTSIRALDLAGALALYEFGNGPLTTSAREGLSFLLRVLATDSDISDLRWAAYMLATVKHECADTWRPIEEYGRGAGHKYGEPVEVTGSDGTKYVNSYYGRGYVQLTWKDNYVEIGKQLGMGDELMLHPERALEPEIAYRIMSLGMRAGTFTGKSLSKYIAGATADYRNARRIINGLDRADAVAGYARRLETILLANS